MEKIRKRLMLLHETKYMTRRMLYRLKGYDHTLRFIFTLTPTEISQFFYIPIRKATDLHHEIHLPNAFEMVHKKKIQVITYLDKLYPKQLFEIPDAP